MAEAGLDELLGSCGYPATTQLAAWPSIGTLLLAAATRVPRAHHIDRITDDDGLAFFLGLTALPKATHLSTYSYRARRESSRTLLTGLVRRLRELGLATGSEGFNCDFHASPHRASRPVPPPAAARRHHPAQGHQRPGTPGPHQEHRPRRAHPADHQRPRRHSQRPLRPLRRADAHRERARRLHLRVQPQRAV